MRKSRKDRITDTAEFQNKILQILPITKHYSYNKQTKVIKLCGYFNLFIHCVRT